MADSRAMEEQSERMNPIQPLSRGTRRGRTSLVSEGSEYVGGGATPSMGLSQYRGGVRSKSPPSEDGMSGGGIIGAGRKSRRKGEPEPMLMGKALGEHIQGLHGAGFFDDFKKGFMSVMRPVANIASMIPGPIGMAAKAASSLMGGAFTIGVREGRFHVEDDGEEIGVFDTMAKARAFVKAQQSARRPKVPSAPRRKTGGMRRAMESHISPADVEAARTLVRMKHSEGQPRSITPPPAPRPSAPPSIKKQREEAKKSGKGIVSGPGYEAVSGGLRTGRYEGKGKLLIQHLPEGEGEEMVVGKGKKTRRPAGASDKRRVRGQMVSKLMREEGMTLAEASRHIKEHGLV